MQGGAEMTTQNDRELVDELKRLVAETLAEMLTPLDAGAPAPQAKARQVAAAKAVAGDPGRRDRART
jgi:hypothetical protein